MCNCSLPRCWCFGVLEARYADRTSAWGFSAQSNAWRRQLGVNCIRLKENYSDSPQHLLGQTSSSKSQFLPGDKHQPFGLHKYMCNRNMK